MNDLSFKLKNTRKSTCITEHITVEIDGKDFLESSEDLNDSIIYSIALLNSAQKEGKHLIFTCECGIADCGGWDYVEVLHSEEKISWKFDHGQKYQFTFEKDLYINKVTSFINELKEKHKDYLEQETAFEPEE